MAKSYFYDENILDWRELVKGEQGERGPVGPIGPQGPAVDIETGLPISVDTTVGTRVFIDDVMVHGDTGWRDVSELLGDNIIVDAVKIYIKRENSTVWLSFDQFDVAEATLSRNPLFNIPNGFASQRPARVGSGSTYELDTALYTAGHTLMTRSNVEPGSRRFYISWSAVSYWPTSLPGVPA